MFSILGGPLRSLLPVAARQNENENICLRGGRSDVKMSPTHPGGG